MQPSLTQGSSKEQPCWLHGASKTYPPNMLRAPEVKPRHKTAAGLGRFEGPILQGTIKSAAKHQSFIRGPYKIFKSQSQLAQDATKPHPRPIQGTTRLPPRCTQDISRRHARSTWTKSKAQNSCGAMTLWRPYPPRHNKICSEASVIHTRAL